MRTKITSKPTAIQEKEMFEMSERIRKAANLICPRGIERIPMQAILVGRAKRHNGYWWL